MSLPLAFNDGKTRAIVKVGRHRRIRAEDLFAYKEQRYKDRSDALSELAVIDVEDDLI